MFAKEFQKWLNKIMWKGLKLKVTKGEIFVFIQLEMADQKLEVVVAATTRQPY